MSEWVKCQCPRIAKDMTPVLLDRDGTLASVSGRPGEPGHAVDDYWWFCEDYAPTPTPDRGGAT